MAEMIGPAKLIESEECRSLFRKATFPVTEETLGADMDLVFKMKKHDIRVQDLVKALKGEMCQEVHNFIYDI